MAITLSDLTSLVSDLGFRATVPDGQDTECGLHFATESYADPAGDRSLLVVCRLDDDGEYLELLTPFAYSTAKCKYKAALFACMLQICFKTRHLQLEHDPSDGEIRFAVDIRLCDAMLTARQLGFMLTCLIRCIEEYHPVLVHAMDTGKIDFSLAWRPKESAPEPPETQDPALEELIAKVGGLDNLEALVARERERRSRG